MNDTTPHNTETSSTEARSDASHTAALLTVVLLVGMVFGFGAYAFFMPNQTVPTDGDPGALGTIPGDTDTESNPVEQVTLTRSDGTATTIPIEQKDAPTYLTTFASAQEYTEYMEAARSVGRQAFITSGMNVPEMANDAVRTTTALPLAAESGATQASAVPERYSDTNVQVAGIDEPDILKTNGVDIFYSPEPRYYGRPMPVSRSIEPNVVSGSTDIAAPEWEHTPPTTKILKGFPVDQLALEGELSQTGDMLLYGSTLAIFAGNEIIGYDVAEPSSPQERWRMELEDRTQIVQSRLYNDTIYLVTRTYSDAGRCPIPLFTAEGRTTSIACTDIHRPDLIVPAESTYHVHKIDIDSGEAQHGISFVGTHNATVYMSSNGLYIAYDYAQSELELFVGFIEEHDDLFPASFMRDIRAIEAYDLSDAAKRVEFEHRMETYLNTLDSDAQLALENELENKMQDYLKAHMRELTSTDIVKVDIATFSVDALGTVPGTLLNQFSIDEYDGNLRVATTISDGGWNSMGNENDVYVLNGSMKIIGSALGMGLDERIYSARFIKDKGYVVTFRETDPFYVLDLSEPTNPRITGELKIPGYSSYLHPLDSDSILGIGKEGSQVKVSLFDVSDPSDPREASKYTLTEYWSDILNTHHAFLQDSRHEVFFLPGSTGGYVFSYTNNSISLVKAVSDIRAKRALFIDDYLYIFGDTKVVVLDEQGWERVEELDL